MKLQNIISDIEKIDPEVYDRIDSRRSAVKNFASFGSKVAIAAIPLAFGSLFKKTYAGAKGVQDAITDVLNFALTLEYLEAEFYKKAVATEGLIAAGDIAAFTTIRDHEVAHVAFLRQTITAMGGTPVTFAFSNFDYTAGNGSGTGPYANVFSNYDTLLAVSQAFEDTGVRAYKGQAGNVMSNKTVLKAALQIHSVEARHASHIRKIRKERGANQQPWITLNDPGGVPGVAAVYAGEENTVQAGIQLTGINGLSVNAAQASKSFDEPLTKEQVMAIVDPFII